MSSANLTGADLAGTNLSFSNLSNDKMTGTNLHTAFSGCFQFGFPFVWYDCGAANLSGAKLNGVDLSYADLSGVDFDGADLSGTNLTMAKLAPLVVPPPPIITNQGYTVATNLRQRGT